MVKAQVEAIALGTAAGGVALACAAPWWVVLMIALTITAMILSID